MIVKSFWEDERWHWESHTIKNVSMDLGSTLLMAVQIPAKIHPWTILKATNHRSLDPTLEVISQASSRVISWGTSSHLWKYLRKRYLWKLVAGKVSSTWYSTHSIPVICLVDEAKQLPKVKLVTFGLLLPAPLPIHLHRLLPSADTEISSHKAIV